MSSTGALRNTREASLRTCLALVLLCVVSNSPLTAAQQMLVTIEKPFYSRSLSGFVSDLDETPIADAFVEECTENWESCFAHTRTDQRGHFSWPDAKKGKHFLRISSLGFNTTQIIVIVSRLSTAEFRIELRVAT